LTNGSNCSGKGGPAKARALVLAVALAVPGPWILSSCYTTRVLSGGANVLMKRKPVDKVLADEKRPLTREQREKLELTQGIRAFAIRELGLPDNGSYTTFVRLDRPSVVWNVVAAPRLSIEPLTWCFPIAGCVSYRGYFKEERADKFAAKLQRKGNDVTVGGADAYSTLGRFKDPVLSTFLDRREVDLVRLMVHELAHQKLYVKHDTAFNESFATVVEIEGTRRWLEAEGRADEIAALEREFELERRFVRLLLDFRRRLGEMYGSDLSDDEKIGRKAEFFAELPGEYERAKLDWGGDARYDTWFERPLDNARLASLSDYFDRAAPFEELLRQSGRDLETFYARAEALGRLSPNERRRALDDLTPGVD
jgi:predicted aminopeptidase